MQATKKNKKKLLPVYPSGGKKTIRHMSFDPRANLMCEPQHRGCVFLPRFPIPEYNTALKAWEQAT
jgi:hypothetical protein